MHVTSVIFEGSLFFPQAMKIFHQCFQHTTWSNLASPQPLECHRQSQASWTWTARLLLQPTRI